MPPEHGPAGALVDDRLVRASVRDGIVRYAAERRARVPDFVDRNFTLSGSLRLHRKAVGWDLARAPANLALSLPFLATRATAGLARKAGRTGFADRLERRQLLLTTDVAREIEWRVFSDLLELPFAQGERRFEDDALAKAILADERLRPVLLPMLQAIGRHADDERFRLWVREAMANYAGSRVAAGDLANAILQASAGALFMKQWTPGALSLGPALAHVLAQKAAIAAFPLGAGLGGLWYGLFPAAAPAAMTAGVTGGVLLGGALLAAFSGIATDPLQRRLGLHQRRLIKLIDGLEQALLEQTGRFTVRDHYAARVLDLIDAVTAAYRLARPG